MSEKRRALILCTGNSARSQMAEGLINEELAGEWKAYSAGTNPAGDVHPLAVAAMNELGIDIHDHRPKHVREFVGQPFDMVITVCDNARKSCPVWLGQGQVVHHGFPDPAAVEGSCEERMSAFRQIRDAIREQIIGLLRES